jgi:hypothetical protein
LCHRPRPCPLESGHTAPSGRRPLRALPTSRAPCLNSIGPRRCLGQASMTSSSSDSATSGVLGSQSYGNALAAAYFYIAYASVNVKQHMQSPSASSAPTTPSGRPSSLPSAPSTGCSATSMAQRPRAQLTPCGLNLTLSSAAGCTAPSTTPSSTSPWSPIRMQRSVRLH